MDEEPFLITEHSMMHTNYIVLRQVEKTLMHAIASGRPSCLKESAGCYMHNGTLRSRFRKKLHLYCHASPSALASR